MSQNLPDADKTKGRLDSWCEATGMDFGKRYEVYEEGSRLKV